MDAMAPSGGRSASDLAADKGYDKASQMKEAGCRCHVPERKSKGGRLQTLLQGLLPVSESQGRVQMPGRQSSLPPLRDLQERQGPLRLNGLEDLRRLPDQGQMHQERARAHRLETGRRIHRRTRSQAHGEGAREVQAARSDCGEVFRHDQVGDGLREPTDERPRKMPKRMVLVYIANMHFSAGINIDDVGHRLLFRIVPLLSDFVLLDVNEGVVKLTYHVEEEI